MSVDMYRCDDGTYVAAGGCEIGVLVAFSEDDAKALIEKAHLWDLHVKTQQDAAAAARDASGGRA